MLTHRIHAPPLPFVRALQHHLFASKHTPAAEATPYARTLQVRHTHTHAAGETHTLPPPGPMVLRGVLAG